MLFGVAAFFIWYLLSGCGKIIDEIMVKKMPYMW